MRTGIFAAPLIALCLVACGGRDLNRTTAMRLVEGKTFGIVRTNIPVSPRLRSQAPSLIAAGILKCVDLGSVLGWNCAKGPNAKDVTSGQYGGYEYAIGDLSPAKITGITKISEDSAVALVELSFRPNEVYQKYRNEFDQFQKVPYATSVRASFRRYDDGWRFESIQ